MKPRREIDWTGVERGRPTKPRSFIEGVPKSMKRYRRDKLVVNQGKRIRDAPGSVIPFSSEEEAADEQANLLSDM